MRRKKFLALLVSAGLCMNAVMPVMAEEAADAAQEVVEEAADAAEEAVEEAAEEVQEAVEEAVEEVQAAADDLAEDAEEAVQEAMEAAEDAAEALEEAVPAAVSDLDFNTYLKGQLTDCIEAYGALYENNLEISKKSLEGSEATLSATLEDAGKALIGMFAPIDLSWLNSLDLAAGVSIQDGKEAELMTLYVNDKPIITFDVQMDLETMDMLMAAPDLSPLYIKANYMDILQTSAESGGSSIPVDPQVMKAVMSALVKFASNPPEKEVITRLMENYMLPFADAFIPGENSEYTVELDNVAEESTVLSGMLTESAAKSWMEDLLTRAKDDEDILSLITNYGPEGEDLTASYQEAVGSLIADLEEAGEPEDDSAIVLRLCVNADGKTIGSQCSMVDGEEEEIISTAFAPSDGVNVPYYMDFTMDGTSLALYGTGTVGENGLVSGSYTLDVDNQPVVDILVEDYDPESVKEGGFVGKYYITAAAPGEETDEEMAQMLQFMSAFALNIESDFAVEGGEARVTVESSGADLGTISLYAGLGEPIEIIDPEALGEDEVVAMDEEGMNTFLSSMDPTSILSNLSEAGVTDEVLGTLVGSLMGGGAAPEEPAA